MTIDWQRFKPRYWFQNEPTDRTWDRVLNTLLDGHTVEICDRYKVKVGNASVWVANWPYAYGKPDGGSLPCHGLPTVQTRKRLRRAVEDAVLAKVSAEQSA